MALAYDDTRLPAGILISASNAVARPVGTIIYDTTSNTLQRSISEDSASYIVCGPGSGNTVVTLRTLANGGTIVVTTSASITLTNNGAFTGNLPIPTFVGQEMLITVGTDTMGAFVITAASAVNRTGNNTLTLSDVNDFIALEGYKFGAVLAWRVIANDGVALTTV